MSRALILISPDPFHDLVHLRLTAILCRRLILGLLFSYRSVVVDEHKGALVIGVDIALCALVART